MRIKIQINNAEYSNIADATLPGVIKALVDNPGFLLWLKLLSKFKRPVKKITTHGKGLEITIDIRRLGNDY